MSWPQIDVGDDCPHKLLKTALIYSSTGEGNNYKGGTTEKVEQLIIQWMGSEIGEAAREAGGNRAQKMRLRVYNYKANRNVKFGSRKEVSILQRIFLRIQYLDHGKICPSLLVKVHQWWGQAMGCMTTRFQVKLIPPCTLTPLKLSLKRSYWHLTYTVVKDYITARLWEISAIWTRGYPVIKGMREMEGIFNLALEKGRDILED